MIARNKLIIAKPAIWRPRRDLTPYQSAWIAHHLKNASPEQRERAIHGIVAAQMSNVVAGSQTFNSGSGNFVCPWYNNLVVECWGAGAGGNGLGFGFTIATDGANTTHSTHGMTASGGDNPSNNLQTATGGPGGTASGGNISNLTGTSGGNAATGQATGSSGGAGGAAAGGGGAGGAARTNAGAGAYTGNNGTAPGGGGGGARVISGGTAAWAGGGGGGGYCQSLFTFGSGTYPAVGSNLAYNVGAAGANGASGGGSPAVGGDGSAGRVLFTWI